MPEEAADHFRWALALEPRHGMVHYGLGLVLVILMGDFLMVVPFAMVALVLIAIRPPRPASFLEANRNRAQNFG